MILERAEVGIRAEVEEILQKMINPFFPMFPFVPPENIGKPKDF